MRVRALGELEGKLREIARVAGCGPCRVNCSRILRVTVSSEPPQGRNAARIRVRCRVRGGFFFIQVVMDWAIPPSCPNSRPRLAATAASGTPAVSANLTQGTATTDDFLWNAGPKPRQGHHDQCEACDGFPNTQPTSALPLCAQLMDLSSLE